MKKLLSILVISFLLSGNAYASPVKTTWVIEKYIGSGAYSDPEKLVGKTQRFFKGLAEFTAKIKIKFSN